MFSWFATKNGRIFTNVSISIVTASTFSVPLLINGPLIDQYEKVVSFHEKEEPKKLSPSLEAFARKVLDECDLKEAEKRKFRFFYSYGLDLLHLGGKESPWGVSIGIPFTFEPKQQQSYGNLRFTGWDDSEDWIYECPELVDTFSLPEEAKKYAIAREIYSAKFYNIFETAFITSGSLFVIPALLSKRINAFYNTFKYPLSTRIWMYVIIYGISLLFYMCCKNPTQHLFDKKCDDKIAKLGQEYIEGGILFYENALAQNKLLRELFKSRGESMYTKNGDENYWLFPPKLPLSKRLEYFKTLKNQTAKT